MTKKFSKKYIDYVAKRSPSWMFRRWLCFALILGRDCVCPLLPAHHAEHLTYANLGSELPLRDIVPLNRNVHKVLTWLKDWIPGFRVLNAVILRSLYAFWISVELLSIYWLAKQF